MLTPEQLETAQIEASKITARMQKNIMEKIIQSIRKSGEITSSTDYLIFRAREMRLTKEYIKEQIQKELKLSNKEIETMFRKAGELTYAYDENIYKLSGTPYTEFSKNDTIQRIIDEAIERTQGEMYNITQSMGFAKIVEGKTVFTPLTEYYQDVMDDTFYSVFNGTATVDEAVRKATRQMSDSGIRVVDYASGHHNRIDVATRRNIMTSLTQMQEQISNHNAEELKTTVFEFSWHSGYRPSHGWGGQRYDTTGKYYPTKDEVYKKYGGGTMDDYNCRHSVYPTFKEFPPMYSKEQLKEMAKKEKEKKEWNGKKYNKYEQTQKARQMETSMRKIRREIDLLKANPDINADAIRSKRIRYRAMMDEYSRFCNYMGLAVQKNRIYQDMLGRV